MRRFWLLTLLFSIPVPSFAQSIDPAQRDVLIALYESTGGPQWRSSQGWLGPVGTECSWQGVLCLRDAGGRPSVSELNLVNNGLVGTLPRSLETLSSLTSLRVEDNRLGGTLPDGLRARWRAGTLQFTGYAGQFAARVSSIELHVATGEGVCQQSWASLAPDGSASRRSEVCFYAWPNSPAKVSCEIKQGLLNRADFDRVVLFMEDSGFFQLAGRYERAMARASLTEIDVQGQGLQKKVVNAGSSGPQQLWATEQLLLQLLDNATWRTTRRARSCGLKQ